MQGEKVVDADGPGLRAELRVNISMREHLTRDHQWMVGVLSFRLTTVYAPDDGDGGNLLLQVSAAM
jgi:hypothetical protein